MPEYTSLQKDYDDMFIASKSDTEEQIHNAEYVYKLLHDFVMDAVSEPQKES